MGSKYVFRNINKQILKYYQKDIDPSIDLDEIDDKDDVFKYVKFNSKAEKNEFIYIDYPYEIYAAAKPMEKNLPSEINGWIMDMTNREDEEFTVVYYSLDEEALTIQSSYFFLSKIGTRIRKVIFPKDFDEIKNEFDVIVTSNKDLVENNLKGNSQIYTILINNLVNEGCKDIVNKNYNSLSEMIKDESILNELKEFVVDRKK